MCRNSALRSDVIYSYMSTIALMGKCCCFLPRSRVRDSQTSHFYHPHTKPMLYLPLITYLSYFGYWIVSMSISVLEKVSSGIVIQKHPQAASLWHGICMLSHCSNFTDIGVGPSCTWFNVFVLKRLIYFLRYRILCFTTQNSHLFIISCDKTSTLETQCIARLYIYATRSLLLFSLMCPRIVCYKSLFQVPVLDCTYLHGYSKPSWWWPA